MRVFILITGCMLAFFACKTLSTQNSITSALPNDGITGAHRNETFLYRQIVERIRVQFRQPATGSPPNLEWPLRTAQPSLLNRYGTPTLIIVPQQTDVLSLRNPDSPIGLSILHEAVDFSRTSPTESDTLLAPWDGIAFPTFDGPEGHEADDPYGRGLVVYNPASGLAAVILHALPDPTMFPTRESSQAVHRGDAVGRLAPTTAVKDQYEPRFRHAHVGVVDVHTGHLINPVRLMGRYVDRQPPVLDNLYVLDDAAQRQSGLVRGRLDLVVRAHDRDGVNDINFEIAGLAWSARDPRGNVIYSVPMCRFDDLMLRLFYGRDATETLLDFGNARSQTSSEQWSGGQSTDAANPNRTFRYVLTHLVVESDGRCAVTADTQGYLEIPASMPFIDVTVELMDHHDNKTIKTVRLFRESI